MTELILMRRPDHLLQAVDSETVEFVEKLVDGEAIKAALIVDENDAGTKSMLDTWWMWMHETAVGMNAYGCRQPLYVDDAGVSHGTRPLEAADCHHLFTSLWLGANAAGARFSWRLRGVPEPGTVRAPRDLRLHAMDHHVAWCAERGIVLTIPRKGEYFQHRSAQEH